MQKHFRQYAPARQGGVSGLIHAGRVGVLWMISLLFLSVIVHWIATIAAKKKGATEWNYCCWGAEGARRGQEQGETQLPSCDVSAASKLVAVTLVVGGCVRVATVGTVVTS